MKAARLDKSKRLKRVLSALKRYSKLSTMQIIEKANVCAVNSIISELRQNGFDITCHRSGDAWFYRLVK